MDEHDLQRILTKQWWECGLRIDDRPQMLVAWEVMLPSWDINNPKNFGEPALDFLVVDDEMHFTVIEVKNRLAGVKPMWQTMCQVTHRSVLLSQHFSSEKLNDAHAACWSGRFGRVPKNGVSSFQDSYRRAFGKSPDVPDSLRSVSRCIAAVALEDSLVNELKAFNRLKPEELRTRACEELSSQQAKRELNRFRDICISEHFNRVAEIKLMLLIHPDW